MKMLKAQLMLHYYLRRSLTRPCGGRRYKRRDLVADSNKENEDLQVSLYNKLNHLFFLVVLYFLFYPFYLFIIHCKKILK